jgi:hypothetical protein
MSQSLLFSLAIKTIIHHEGRGTHEDFSGFQGGRRVRTAQLRMARCFFAVPVSALHREAAGLFLRGKIRSIL